MGFININASAFPARGTPAEPLARAFGITSDINMIKPFGDTTYHATAGRGEGAHGERDSYGVVYTLSPDHELRRTTTPTRASRLFEFKELNQASAGYDRTHNLRDVLGLEPARSARAGAGRPKARRRRSSAAGRLNGIMAIMSGTPINITQGNAFNLNAGGSGQFPDQVKTHGGDHPDNWRPGGRSGSGERVLRPQRVRGGEHPRGPAPALRELAAGTRSAALGSGTWTSASSSRLGCRGARGCRSASRCSMLSTTRNFANPGADISNAGAFGFDHPDDRNRRAHDSGPRGAASPF